MEQRLSVMVLGCLGFAMASLSKLAWGRGLRVGTGLWMDHCRTQSGLCVTHVCLCV
jgi:hypothetical protein